MTKRIILITTVLFVFLLIAGFYNSPQPRVLKANLLLDAHASLGEGAIWNQEEEILYWVDIEQGILKLFNPSTRLEEDYNLGKRVGTVVPYKKREVIVALEDGVYHYNLDQDSLTYITNPESNKPDNRFNDGKCDPAGRFWFGSMSLVGKRRNSALYCLDLDGQVRKMVDSVTISNGIVWSLDHTKMYYIDTPTRVVKEYRYDNNTGNIQFIRNAVIFPQGIGSPDGMTIDENGMLWIAHWGGSCVGCWNPENGELVIKIEVPVLNVTSCAFGGKNLEELFITTASTGIREKELIKYPNRGGLFVVRPGVKGIPSNLYNGKL
jgi:sugar lactone lactonase YvrE